MTGQDSAAAPHPLPPVPQPPPSWGVRRVTLVVVGITAAVALAGAGAYWFRHRGLHLDKAAWIAAKPPEHEPRRRMLHAVERMMVGGEINSRDTAIAHLGEPGERDEKHHTWGYPVGHGDHFLFEDILRLRFDDDGRLVAHDLAAGLFVLGPVK